MEKLTPEELSAFLDFYDADHESVDPTVEVIASLIRRGILTQEADGTLSSSEVGDTLYKELQGDEPYEGI
jgi:hypothetical protein